MKNFQYILFDLDGTLSNTSKGVFKATDYMANKMNLPILPEEDKRTILGPPLWQSFKRLYGLEEDKLVLSVELFREYYHDKGCYENEMYDGMVELLAKLKANGKILAVATSKPNNITPKVINSFGISDLISFISAPDPACESDDKSVLITTALKGLGCQDLSTAVMVGDRLYDILAANKVGIASIGVTYGFGSREELEESKATYIVDTTEQIGKLILGEV